jgi:hypothetical protein
MAGRPWVPEIRRPILEGLYMSDDDSTRARHRWEDQYYRILSGAAAGLLAVGSIVYHYLEDWSWVDSIYFSTVAVTTVGFGDLTPTTDRSKLFTVFYLLSGIAIITSYLNLRFRHRHANVQKRRN